MARGAMLPNTQTRNHHDNLVSLSQILITLGFCKVASDKIYSEEHIDAIYAPVQLVRKEGLRLLSGPFTDVRRR